LNKCFNQIDLVARPSNLLITGICRTGKTTLAIELVKKLVDADVPVTLIDIDSTSFTSPKYDEFFVKGNYSQETRFATTDSLFSGIAIERYLPQNRENDRVISILTERLRLFPISFLFVEEPTSLSFKLQEFLATVAAAGRKEGVYSVHTIPGSSLYPHFSLHPLLTRMADMIPIPNFEKEILLDRYQDRFNYTIKSGSILQK
jgi:hypothetical protein